MDIDPLGGGGCQRGPGIGEYRHALRAGIRWPLGRSKALVTAQIHRTQLRQEAAELNGWLAIFGHVGGHPYQWPPARQTWRGFFIVSIASAPTVITAITTISKLS